jgi:hypothetical protein
MNRRLIVAILIISTAPLYAQAQSDPANLKADAQRVVSIISGDEAKTRAYCEAKDTADQIFQAGQRKDSDKVRQLAGKLTEQSKNLGSEYLALMGSLSKVDLSTIDRQDILSVFDMLNKSCPH